MKLPALRAVHALLTAGSCALALPAWSALPFWAGTPDARAVQQAYDAARVEPEAQKQHVVELVINTAKCSQPADAGFHVCQIDFVRRDEPQGRLYFDVVTVQESQGRWQLLSGLCKGRPPVR